MTEKTIWCRAWTNEGKWFPLEAHISHCSLQHVVILDLEKKKQQKHGRCDPDYTGFKC